MTKVDSSLITVISCIFNIILLIALAMATKKAETLELELKTWKNRIRTIKEAVRKI